MFLYSVKHSDRNRSKTDFFLKPTTCTQHVWPRYEQKITFARHDYGRIGVFRIQMRSFVQELQPLKKCPFSTVLSDRITLQCQIQYVFCYLRSFLLLNLSVIFLLYLYKICIKMCTIQIIWNTLLNMESKASAVGGRF